MEEPLDDDDEDHFLPLEAQFSGAPVGGDGGGGDDGGDSSGDEGDDQGEHGDLVPVEESDEGSDNETDMVVLDPNHVSVMIQKLLYGTISHGMINDRSN